MSGHSHYATTKRQKELKDNARGQVFSKLARSITIAAKTGGSTNPDANFRLRIAIDKAHAASMPKENVDRALLKAQSTEAIEEVMYEGFGPAGILIMVNVATDNRNRTNAEIRNLFEKNASKMGVPGSVSFNFDPVGFVLVKKENNVDEQILKLIDQGAIDVLEINEGIEVYLPIDKIEAFSAELIQRPKNYQDIPAEKISQVESFLENFENHDDVQAVYSNANL